MSSAQLIAKISNFLESADLSKTTCWTIAEGVDTPYHTIRRKGISTKILVRIEFERRVKTLTTAQCQHLIIDVFKDKNSCGRWDFFKAIEEVL